MGLNVSKVHLGPTWLQSMFPNPVMIETTSNSLKPKIKIPFVFSNAEILPSAR